MNAKFKPTESEIAALKSIVRYWDEVSERDWDLDKNQLSFELDNVCGLLGYKVLYMVAEYIKQQGK
jgi:hypothetical protein